MRWWRFGTAWGSAGSRSSSLEVRPSLALALTGWGLYTAALGRAPLPFVDMIGILARMNLLLVAFNVVPGFPLDGGRVLRAALWGLWGRLSPATRVASGVGSFFGTMVLVMGFLWIAYGNLIGGLWFVLIGFFLRGAARSSYQQLLLRQAVEGVKARDLMSPQLVWVSPDMSLLEAVDEVMLPKGLSEVPVTDNGRLVGELSLKRLRGVDRGAWERLVVSDVMAREIVNESLSPEEDALKVLTLLGQSERTLPVVEHGELVGVVSRKEALRRLQLKLTYGP
jgi:predicted transcriptional regulator